MARFRRGWRTIPEERRRARAVLLTLNLMLVAIGIVLAVWRGSRGTWITLVLYVGWMAWDLGSIWRRGVRSG